MELASQLVININCRHINDFADVTLLNQVYIWFLEISFVSNISMCVCAYTHVSVCIYLSASLSVSFPKGINN